MLLVDASEGPLPQTRFVLQKALATRPAADGLHQQDRPARRAHRRSARRGLRPVHRPRRHRGAARVPARLHQRPRRHRDARAGAASRPTCARSSTSSSRRCRARRSMSSSPTQFQCNNLDYNDYVGRLAIGRIEARRARERRAVHALHAGRRAAAGEDHAALRLARPQAHRDAARHRRRHRRRRRHRGDQHRRHHRRPRAAARPARHPHRRADHRHDLRRQHLAVGGPRGRVRHLAQAARAPGLREAAQRQRARRGHRVARSAARHRTRRAAAGDPHRDHAPRGLRAAGLEADGGDARGRRRPPRADRAAARRRRPRTTSASSRSCWPCARAR